MSFEVDFDIRFSEMADLAVLESFFIDEKAFQDFPFGPEEKEMALRNWIGFSRFHSSLTGTWQNRPCAIGTLFLMPYRRVAHHASFYLIVDPTMRNRGIGSSMVKNLLHLAKSRFSLESLHVEVFEPSLLLPILEKFGFSIFARQENFVHVDDRCRSRILLEHFF